MFPVTIKELRKGLATLFTEKEEAQALIGFTSLETGWIDFSGAPLLMWSRILTEAMKHDKGILEIVENAYAEYPKNKIIDAAFNNGVDFEKKTEKTEKYIPFQKILKHINKDSFGEIRRVDCNRSEQVKQYYKSIDKSCTITYAIGNNKDKPNSFAERIMLQTLADSKDIDSGEHNCWLYRKPNGDLRVDEIPFDIRPDLELSKRKFCEQMELFFQELNMDNAKKFFARQKYRTFSISINYNYGLGDEILASFTAWLHETFSEIPNTKFQIFFVFTGFRSIETLQKEIDDIANTQQSIPIVPIRVSNPIDDFDIQAWKGQINLESYTQEEFINDLTFLKVPGEDIEEYKSTKKLSMQVMELFQNSLFDTFHKNP